MLPFDFSRAKKVLLNGYQTWTLTQEMPPDARMFGLRGRPSGLVDAFALDGAGDYRFYEYNGRRGQLHGWTYGYVLDDEGCFLVASCSEDAGFTLIEFDTVAGEITVSAEEGSADAEGIGARVALVRAADLDDAFDAWFAAAGVTPLPAQPLVGYTSWYRHYEAITEEKLLADLAGCAAAMSAPVAGAGAEGADAATAGGCDAGAAVAAAGSAQAGGIDTAGCARVFQIDDGYAPVGDWLDVRLDAFPRGMAPLAAEIRAAGFVPGLWVSPFLCRAASRLAAEHPDWLLVDEAGHVVTTGSNWGGAVALDTLHPEVRAYVARVLRTMTEEWGFGLLKLDFLFAACMVPHGGMTRGALMADALDLVRESVAPGTLLLGCGVPLASAFGRVEYCRVSCDVSPFRRDELLAPMMHQECVSTRHALATTQGRRQLNGRAFRADADVVFLREGTALSAAKRAALLDAACTCGSVLLTSDDMGAWTPDQRAAFQAAVRRLK